LLVDNRDAGELRNDFLEQVQPLPAQFPAEACHASDIAAGTGEAFNEACGNRIRPKTRQNNGNRFGRIHNRPNHVVASSDHDEINFEGQAAIELEMAALKGIDETYPFDIEPSDPWQIDVRPMIESIVREVRYRTQSGAIAAKFHNTVAAVIVQVCRRLRECEGLNQVCLSGGTFQNMYLLERAVAGLRGCGFQVLLHAKVPPNDGGISLGQAVIANEIIRRGG